MTPVGSLIVFVALLLLVIFVPWLVLSFLGSVLGPAINRYNPLLMRSREAGIQAYNSSNPMGLPACGQCGYPAVGITTFNCPECGADLREVGIVRPGAGRSIGMLPLLLCAYTVVFLILAGVVSQVIESHLPIYSDAHADISLSPAHDEYSVQVAIEVTEVNRSGYQNNSFGFSTWGFAGDANPSIQFDLDGFTPNMKIESLSLEIQLETPPRGASVRPFLVVDTDTGGATWQGLDGKANQSVGSFTPQDMLAFLKTAGIDDTKTQTIDEADELHSLIVGLSQYKNQFTLNGFDSYASGANSSYDLGPKWARPAYAATCIVLWLIGIVLFTRWARRDQRTRTKI